METPSSTRRVTRSQALASHVNNDNNSSGIPISRKIEDSEMGLSKSRQRKVKQQEDRSALIDITNDSPIVGLAMGSLETPSSATAKQRSSRANNKTPGTGEALLRGQVKTLLQRVEEEAELSKISLESRPFLHLKGFVNSPAGLLAPTPANTPQISSLSSNNGDLASAVPSPVVEEQLISQVISNIFDGKKQESLETEKILITRSLLLDFSEKSENNSDSSECPSGLTYQAGGGESYDKEKSCAEDDDASVWSIQVNASTHDEDEEEGEEKNYYDEEEDDEIDQEEGDEDDGGLVDELCEGINNIFVNGSNEKKIAPKFEGKHTRFVYDSEDELVGAEEECAKKSSEDSPSKLRLKGLPTPKGKHLRFPVQEEEGGEDN
ncbi:bromodomain adjacent to zinc finger domain protein 2B-like [Juglans microcarpa x Juglans regia]|uniref:bromodomain adjacent to zinc finger domain protein 2B-like n=1 Tax=Juglans microcarpa x Juglans regia TaxID=2249226 RepID=UPI001B7F6419|nr:bromodomain adjacent to zinc finger domain protein 2B-like [Juglans microcarpa x Juglans regia]